MSPSNRAKLIAFALLTLAALGLGLPRTAILALAALTALIPLADALARDPAPAGQPAPRHEPA
ncbi:hypothetical protein [Micromonospora sp. NBS 11-29]|uniref:hypothetical protein n=1 Tax=Micromonospora sp. NBS 11-29 TaxID=1960879 RepID=UPI000B77D817|nr:hypothetical protein [Micromonospora sp. NBS 11-29]